MIDLSDYNFFIPEVYQPYLNNKDRNLIFYGGSGSGKSVFCALKILYRMLTESGITILIVRKTEKSIRESCFALFRTVISMLNFTNNEGKPIELFKLNKTNMSIECTVNESRVIVAGLDNSDRLRSIVAHSIYIEEADEITRDDYLQLNLRLRGYSKFYKQIMMSFNPRSIYSWIKEYFFDNEVANTTIKKTTYLDNPYYDNSEYEDQFGQMEKFDESKFRVYALGEWGEQLEGLVFANNVFYHEDINPNIKNTIYGVDFGFTAPSTIMKIDFDKDDKFKVYLTELLYQTKLTNTELIEEMNRLNISKSNYIYADHAEPARIKEIKQAGYNIKPCKKGNVEIGVNVCKNYKFYTTKKNKNLNRELNNYSYIEKDGNYTDKILRTEDHAIDAVRYALLSFKGKKATIKMSDLYGVRR